MMYSRLHAHYSLTIVLVLICVLITAAGTGLMIMRQTARDSAIAVTERVAVAAAGEVRRPFERAMTVARQNALVMGEMVELGLIDPDVHNEILRNTLYAEMDLIGVWSIWEPGPFTTASTPEGFMPYWARTRGDITAVTDRDPDILFQDPTYRLPFDQVRETVLDPMQHPDFGNSSLTTSFAVPIEVNGQVSGVTGVDIALDDIQSVLSLMRPMGQGTIMLLSSSGMIVAAPDEQLLGQRVEDIPYLDDVQTITQSFRPLVLPQSLGPDGEVIRVAVPFRISGSRERWAIVADIPHNVALAQMNTVTRSIILVGLVLAIGAAAVATLFSAQIKAQSQLISARDEAQRANQLKSEFLANMSHEIRTPLNGVLGMAQLLNFGELTDSQREKVQTILSSGRALLQLLEDVLDISRIEAGVMKLDLEADTPLNLLKDTQDVIAGPAQLKGLTIEIDAGPMAETAFLCDPKRTRQVLTNLAGNAVKFTEEGYIRLSARVNAGLIHFSVTDTGPGVPEAARQRIFERFRQADNSNARQHEGVGLGLSISSELVGLAGGEMGLEENPEGGSVFWFELPFNEADQESGEVDEAEIKLQA